MELHVKQIKKNIAEVITPKMVNYKNAKSISNELVDLLNSLDCIILNLKNLILLDSSGIGVFIDIVKKAEQKNVKFVFCSLQNQVIQILKLSKLIDVFSIYNDEEEALNSVL